MLCFLPDEVELVQLTFVNCACTTDVFLAKFLSLAEHKLKGKKPYEEALRMRMLKIHIKILNIKFRSV